MKSDKHPLVLVEWVDAHGDTAKQFTRHDVPPSKGWIARTPGFLVQNDAAGMSLYLEEIDDGLGDDKSVEWRGYVYIPAPWVKTITYLGAKRARRARKPAGDHSTTAGEAGT